VRARDAALGVVGPSETVELHVARVDSAVKERIRAYIAAGGAVDSFATPPPADWTTEVGEDTWGVDGSWIYLGDFKIPNILLALIPMPQGNIPMAEDAAELARGRAGAHQTGHPPGGGARGDGGGVQGVRAGGAPPQAGRARLAARGERAAATTRLDRPADSAVGAPAAFLTYSRTGTTR
jgi:hypothetical protein